MNRPLASQPNAVRPTILQMSSYLKRKGWKQVDDGNPNALVFQGLKDIYGKPLVVVLPARRTLIDADRRINDALRSLSTLEAVSPEEMGRIISDSGPHVRRRVISPSRYVNLKLTK